MHARWENRFYARAPFVRAEAASDFAKGVVFHGENPS